MTYDSILKELREELGQEINVTTFEQWQDIKAYGTYELAFKNGELWSFNGKLYNLNILNLSLYELEELNYSKKIL